MTEGSVSKSEEEGTGGGSVLLLLVAVFIVLKLTNVIAWSWWWVFSPLWLPLAIAFGLVMFVLALGALFVTVVMVMDR